MTYEEALREIVLTKTINELNEVTKLLLRGFFPRHSDGVNAAIFDALSVHHDFILNILKFFL